MDIVSAVLTLGIFLGLIILVYGAFFQKSKDTVTKSSDGVETLEQLKQSVEEADNTISNINSVSSLIIEEIDIKYKKLLFLYEMLEEKKKDILEYTNGSDPASNGINHIENSIRLIESSDNKEYDSGLRIMEIGCEMDEVKRFPKFQNRGDILQLYEDGYEVSQIAKELGMGKGEVQMIIGLSKVGATNE